GAARRAGPRLGHGRDDPRVRPPVAALAFRFDAPAEVDAAYDRLVSLGHEGYKGPWDAFWGQRYAVVHDPDGNGVDLFAPNA
ncbi:VOC family protein, partial [Streptosporangium algeriense]